MDDWEIYRQKRMANNPTRIKEAEAHYAQFTAEEEQEQKALLANHALVGSALILLSRGLRPFVEQALEQAYGKNWLQTAETEKWFNRNQLDKRSGKVNLDDVSILVSLITEDTRWQKAFKTKLINEDKNRLYQLREVRNNWAHNKCEEFTARYTHALLNAASKMLKVLGATVLAQQVERMEPVLEQLPQSEINLYDRALALFNDYLENLSSNALTAGDRLIFNRSDVYVPLGLVERQEPARRKPGDGVPDQGADLYQEPRETIREISQDDFYEKVLAQGQSKSRGKRLAIVGEPGSGKTTRLQDIAEWVFEQRDQQGEVAIWVSLGTIGKKSLRDYLRQDWLRDAAGALETAPPEWVSALEALLQSGKVWLLLDGADEMTVPDPLGKLCRDLQAPVFRNVRVVLTCRLNTWEANKNALYTFDVYRNLDFTPEQVSTFIQTCLPESSTALETELAKPGKERIRNLIKNPLRLMLLCSTWQANQRTEGYQLPDTKAKLYAQFVQKIYDWKAETICEQQGWSRAAYCAQQSRLNDFLGELAKQAIDQTHFAIPQSLIQQILDDPTRNLDPALFQLALDIGWLNHVGVAAENPLERVYAFYHPSFQEYFAALAIDDHRFFLNHIPENPRNGTYLVLEPAWQETLLIWWGISPLSDQRLAERINLLIAMAEFEDYEFKLTEKSGFRSFHQDAVFFCMVKGLFEFRVNNPDKKIIDWPQGAEKLLKWAFGYPDEEKNDWISSSPRKPLCVPEIVSARAIAVVYEIADPYFVKWLCKSLTAYSRQKPKDKSDVKNRTRRQKSIAKHILRLKPKESIITAINKSFPEIAAELEAEEKRREENSISVVSYGEDYASSSSVPKSAEALKELYAKIECVNDALASGDLEQIRQRLYAAAKLGAANYGKKLALEIVRQTFVYLEGRVSEIYPKLGKLEAQHRELQEQYDEEDNSEEDDNTQNRLESLEKDIEELETKIEELKVESQLEVLEDLHSYCFQAWKEDMKCIDLETINMLLSALFSTDRDALVDSVDSVVSYVLRDNSILCDKIITQDLYPLLIHRLKLFIQEFLTNSTPSSWASWVESGRYYKCKETLLAISEKMSYQDFWAYWYSEGYRDSLNQTLSE